MACRRAMLVPSIAATIHRQLSSSFSMYTLNQQTDLKAHVLTISITHLPYYRARTWNEIRQLWMMMLSTIMAFFGREFIYQPQAKSKNLFNLIKVQGRGVENLIPLFFANILPTINSDSELKLPLEHWNSSLYSKKCSYENDAAASCVCIYCPYIITPRCMALDERKIPTFIYIICTCFHGLSAVALPFSDFNWSWPKIA